MTVSFELFKIPFTCIRDTIVYPVSAILFLGKETIKQTFFPPVPGRNFEFAIFKNVNKSVTF